MSEREQFERARSKWGDLLTRDRGYGPSGAEQVAFKYAWQAHAAIADERVRELEAERADLYRQIEKVREERNGIRRKVELPLLGKLKEADERVRELEDAARKVTTCLASQVPVYLEELEQALAKGAKEKDDG